MERIDPKHTGAMYRLNVVLRVERCGRHISPATSLSLLRLIGQALAWNDNACVPETETLLGPPIAVGLWFLRLQAMPRKRN
jgi:hypothetical protein